jgi:two-component system, cell cycle response regulator DivK
MLNFGYLLHKSDVSDNIDNEEDQFNSIRPFLSERLLSGGSQQSINIFQDFTVVPCPKRILIVEDNKVDVRLLSDILKSRGYEILLTGDGLEAIDLALASLPDLILMDIRLPDISGLEVTRRLKDDERSRRIPIVAVTAFAMGWHEREALDSGCDAYISKPIAIPGFLRTIEAFLSRFPHESSTGFADLRSPFSK